MKWFLLEVVGHPNCRNPLVPGAMARVTCRAPNIGRSLLQLMLPPAAAGAADA
jgi:hypothetical protein